MCTLFVVVCVGVGCVLLGLCYDTTVRFWRASDRSCGYCRSWRCFLDTGGIFRSELKNYQRYFDFYTSRSGTSAVICCLKCSVTLRYEMRIGNDFFTADLQNLLVFSALKLFFANEIKNCERFNIYFSTRIIMFRIYY